LNIAEVEFCIWVFRKREDEDSDRTVLSRRYDYVTGGLGGGGGEKNKSKFPDF